jgi:hypothetical protein
LRTRTPGNEVVRGIYPLLLLIRKHLERFGSRGKHLARAHISGHI